MVHRMVAYSLVRTLVVVEVVVEEEEVVAVVVHSTSVDSLAHTLEECKLEHKA